MAGENTCEDGGSVVDARDYGNLCAWLKGTLAHTAVDGEAGRGAVASAAAAAPAAAAT